MEDQTKSLITTAMQQTPSMRKRSSKPSGGGVRRYQFDFNTGQDYKRRPDNSISQEVLRRFSTTHELSRICINARKRQLSQLDWDIVPLRESNLNKNDAEVKSAVNKVKEYFKHIGGYRTRFRQLQDIMVEDLMVLDGVSLYKEKDSAGRLLYLKPVDAGSIRLVVDEFGNTPEPPNIAYRQYTRGKLQGQFTADEMIYDMMNPRSNTPYGLAPLESLIIVVSTALRGGIFNLDYLTYQNIPEGLLEMPEGWSQQMVDEFQDAWDSLVAGNTEANSKLRVVPPGTKYSPTKKPEDMAFKEMNMWLMQVTCAMFDIQPHEIGFTDKTNRATAAEQNDVQERRGIKPLAQMLKENWDDIIQIDLGFPDLEFLYMGLEDADDVKDATAMKMRLQSGEISIDEARISDGLEPLGIETPYILGAGGVTWVTSGVMNAQQEDGTPNSEVPPAPGDPQPENDGNDKTGGNQASSVQPDKNSTSDEPNYDQNNVKASDSIENLSKELLGGWHDMANDELAKFQRFAIDRLKKGKGYRDFDSKVLEPVIVGSLNVQASKAKSADDIVKAVRQTKRDIMKATDASKVKKNKTLEVIYAGTAYAAVKKSMKSGIKDQMHTVADKFGKLDAAPPSTAAFLDQATPALAKTVDAEPLANLYKETYSQVVPATYKQVADAKVDFNLTSNAVNKQLEQKASDLLSKSSLDETTKKTIRPIIESGLKDGKTPAQISKDIKTAAPDIADYRADMIARTETQNVFGEAQARAFREMGVTTKAWVTYGENPCIECETNEGQGPIPIDAMFDSGDDWTPGHVNCECSCDTEQLSLSDEEIDDLWDGE